MGGNPAGGSVGGRGDGPVAGRIGVEVRLEPSNADPIVALTGQLSAVRFLNLR